MAISETKGQGWRANPTQYRKASNILTSTMAAFLFSSHPKGEKDREADKRFRIWIRKKTLKFSITVSS